MQFVYESEASASLEDSVTIDYSRREVRVLLGTDKTHRVATPISMPFRPAAWMAAKEFLTAAREGRL